MYMVESTLCMKCMYMHIFKSTHAFVYTVHVQYMFFVYKVHAERYLHVEHIKTFS